MKVLVAAFGTRGDVQPAVVAAQALISRGHEVVCFVPPSSAAWVRSLGLPATEVGLDYARLVQAVSLGRFRDLVGTLPLLRDEVNLQADAMLEASRGVDVVLGCSVFAAGRLLADLRRVPYQFLCLSPFLLPAVDHPAPWVRGQRWPGWFNRASWAFNELLWGAFLGGPIRARRRKEGLGPRAGLWPQLLGDVNFVAAETAVFPLPRRPLSANRLEPIGALFLESTTRLSAEVEAFLAAGAPPICVGFGSMADPRPAQTMAVVLEAARRSGHRVVISRGWSDFTAAASDAVLVMGEEPHLQLFPRCAAVLHHGGIGTAHAALRAGVPQVVAPQLLDQFFTAHHLEQAGVGETVRRFSLTPSGLAAAFTRCAARAARARALSKQVELAGAERLVDLLSRG